MYVICKEEMSDEQILSDLIANWGHDAGWPELIHATEDLNLSEQVWNSQNCKDLIPGLVKPTYKECGYVIKKVKLIVEK